MAASLAFTVTSSSHAPPHVPSELTVKTPEALGWMSAKHCAYPQDVELALAQPSDVFQLALMAHESSIPQRVVVSVRGAHGDWRTLGFLEFDDNRESGFMARELQTVHLGAANVTLVKLSLSAPHANARNADQQVSLLAVEVTGRPAEALPATTAAPPSAAAHVSHATAADHNGAATPGKGLAALEHKLAEVCRACSFCRSLALTTRARARAAEARARAGRGAGALRRGAGAQGGRGRRAARA